MRGVCVLTLAFVAVVSANAAAADPILNHVYPAGGQAGTSVEVTVAGNTLDAEGKLVCSLPGVTSENLKPNQFRLSIAADVPPGSYDVRVLGATGLSSPRTFVIGNRAETKEAAENDSLETAEPVELNSVINAQIEKRGDRDHFRFKATGGQRVIIEAHAERIDSPLRAILELYDSSDRRLAVNRGFFGLDPLIDFRVPADGEFTVRVFDLVYAGSADHIYRLAIDTGPRVAFAHPCVVQAGRKTRVTLFGWNLEPVPSPPGGEGARRADEGAAIPTRSVSEASAPRASVARSLANASGYDQVSVEILNTKTQNSLPLGLRSNQLTSDVFAWHLPGSHAPTMLSVTDVPVVLDETSNHSPTAAQTVTAPCEVAGQLTGSGEQDWFALDAKRGEVFWLEAFGDRIGSPVDLDLSVLDATGTKELARFSDTIRDSGGTRFPSSHHDPAGRWVAPHDGRFLILIRNLTGGLDDDPRRVYRLSLRREVPDFSLAVVPRSDQPSSLNLSRGGRTVLDVFAVRRRGLTGSIRVSAANLPLGIECSDIWIGPDVDRAPLVVSASRAATADFGTIQLTGHAEGAGLRPVRGASVVRSGRPNGWSRLTDDVPVAVTGKAPARLIANGHEKRTHHLYGELTVRHSPGSILDVAVEIERLDPSHQAAVKLHGLGLPGAIRNSRSQIPAGKNRGHVSFYLPPNLPTGHYTITLQGETTVPTGQKDKNGQVKTQPVTLFSNPVRFEVQSPAFVVEIDEESPTRIRRGETLQVRYSCRRINGFISKIHTELYAADEVIGLRGRGVTFVGQTSSGTIQIVANEDAPLGQQPFLRLYAVGVVEDEAVFHGSRFLKMEIVE